MISKLLGIDSDFIIIGLVVVTLVMLIIMIVNMVQISQLKKRYDVFMTGKDAKSLEKTLIKRLDQVDGLLKANAENEKNIKEICSNMKFTFQKVGLVKYDAFHEMGGKLSFSLALLNETDDGFVLNAVHSREGCYTYMKEIIGGNSIIILCKEEQEALDMAKSSKISKKTKKS